MRRHDFLRELHRRLRPRTYLEIGVNDGKSLALSRAPSIGVDPEFRVTEPIQCDVQLVKATSDDFFERPDPIRHLRSGRNPMRNAAPRPPAVRSLARRHDPRPRVHRRHAPVRVRPARLHERRALQPRRRRSSSSTTCSRAPSPEALARRQPGRLGRRRLQGPARPPRAPPRPAPAARRHRADRGRWSSSAPTRRTTPWASATTRSSSSSPARIRSRSPTTSCSGPAAYDPERLLELDIWSWLAGAHHGRGERAVARVREALPPPTGGRPRGPGRGLIGPGQRPRRLPKEPPRCCPGEGSRRNGGRLPRAKGIYHVGCTDYPDPTYP